MPQTKKQTLCVGNEMNETYKAECKKDHCDWYLSVTHNGYQWTSINIKDPDYEIPLIIKALNTIPLKNEN